LGRVLVDMAVAVAGGAMTIFDIAVLAHRAGLFGQMALDSTCWRLLDGLTPRAWTRWRGRGLSVADLAGFLIGGAAGRPLRDSPD
jgi:hypothetical protein